LYRSNFLEGFSFATLTLVLLQLCGIPTKLSSGSVPESKNIPVDFDSPNTLSSGLNQQLVTFKITCPISARVLDELHHVSDIQTQLYCYPKLVVHTGGTTHQSIRRRGKQTLLWYLNIIIFGTEKLGENIGEYLSNRKMYLQDPVGCTRSVAYRNPHIFPPDSGETVMTDSFDLTSENLEIERLNVGPDLLAQLMEDETPLAETEAPGIVTTALFPYVFYRWFEGVRLTITKSPEASIDFHDSSRRGLEPG
jgi:SWI/SNF-related matrix-associated actin-dependent regulator of chromatin subfamily A3